MTKYSRVSYPVRCHIYALLQVKTSIAEIASLTGFNKTTIYREIKRNKGLNNFYAPELAQTLASRRYRQCRRHYIVTKKFKTIIKNWLEKGLSPEIIAGRLKREYGKAPSHQSIYNFVYYSGLRHLLANYGKRGAGRYIQRRRVRDIKHGKSIHERPEIASRRNRIGDWERDTMHTLNGVQVLVCQDRKSRFIKIGVVSKRTCLEVGRLTEKLIYSTKKKAYTVTNDNGGDFKGRSDMKLKTYFCDPMSPHQRGSVENVIKSLRKYIGRKTDVSKYRREKIEEIEMVLNHRPRKVLDYRTPYEVYYGQKVALADLI